MARTEFGYNPYTEKTVFEKFEGKAVQSSQKLCKIPIPDCPKATKDEKFDFYVRAVSQMNLEEWFFVHADSVRRFEGITGD